MMKYLLPVCIVALLATSCNKKRCYDCSWIVDSNQPTTPARIGKEYCNLRTGDVDDLERDMRTRGYDDFSCKSK